MYKVYYLYHYNSRMWKMGCDGIDFFGKYDSLEKAIKKAKSIELGDNLEDPYYVWVEDESGRTIYEMGKK